PSIRGRIRRNDFKTYRSRRLGSCTASVSLVRGLVSQECHRSLRTRVDRQPKHIWPRVVTGGIEHAAVTAGASKVEIGIEDSRRAHERPGNEISVRTDDRGVSAAEPVVVPAVESVEPGERLADVASALARRDTDDVNATFPGNVAQRRNPYVGVVPRRSEIDVEALAVERGTRQRHVVLPTDQAPDAGEAGVMHVEV